MTAERLRGERLISEEMGHRVTCAQCTLCKGLEIQARNVAIIAHGIGKRSFIKLSEVR